MSFTKLTQSNILDDLIYFKYQNDQLAPPCVRLLNATHQVGCSTGEYPQSGTLMKLTEDSDYQIILNSGPHSPYIVLMGINYFTKENIIKLHNSYYVIGVLVDVVNQSEHLPLFSPNSKCPNDVPFKNNSDCNLNPQGNDLDFYDFNEFPIFAINDKSVLSNLQNCIKYNEHISDVSYSCSVQLTSRMFAGANTNLCIRRSAYVIPQLTSSTLYCAFLQGWTIWGTLFPLKMNFSYDSKENGIILVATQLDSSAFFHDLSYGAEHDLSGIVVLLGVAEVLGKLKMNKQISDNGNPIVFTFFDGEDWQHIGSSKMAYDISQGNFPIFPTINLKHEGIKHFIGIEQVALSINNTWHIHSSKTASDDLALKQAFNKSAHTNNITFNFRDDAHSLQSTMTYFSHFNNNISGSIITDYSDSFENRYYGSLLDNARNIGLGTNSDLIQNTQHLCTSITQSLLKISQTTVDDSASLKCNESLLLQLFDCFLVNSSCALFSEVSPPDLPASSGPVSRYVNIQITASLYSLITHNLLAYFIGNKAYTSGDNCTVDISPTSESLYRSFFAKGSDYNSSTQQGVCINSTVYYSQAISPSIGLNSFGADSIYSTWTESVWEAPSIWIYLSTNNYIIYGEFMLGFIMTLSTIIFAIIIKVKSPTIFK